MIISSTYFLEKALAFLLSNLWIWGALAIFIAVGFTLDALPVPFFMQFGLAALFRAIWSVGIAAVALHDGGGKNRWGIFVEGAFFALKGFWYPTIVAFAAGLFAYCAFEITHKVSVEVSFMALVIVGIFELFLWGVGLLIQPYIASGNTQLKGHVLFFRSLSRRTFESLLKLLVVFVGIVFLGTVFILQVAWSFEYLVGSLLTLFKSSWIAPLWMITLLQRAVSGVWYGIYTLCGTYLYLHTMNRA